MKKTIKVIFIIVGLLSILGIGGCVATMFLFGGAVNDSIVEMEEQEQSEQAVLDEIFKNAPEPTVVRDEYNYNVTYTFTNDSDLDFDYIELQLNSYDKDGVKLGTQWTNITDVKAGQTFKMTVDLYEDGTETFDLNAFTNNAFE